MPHEANPHDVNAPCLVGKVAFNPSSMSKVLVRATNWLGDAVMSLPAIRTVRQVFPHAHIAVVARPWVADLYARELAIDRVIPYTRAEGAYRRQTGIRRAPPRAAFRRRHPSAQNAFDRRTHGHWLAGIPERIGYNRDARGLLLTQRIPVPEPGEIPRHERFYYLELLRRAGMIERFPKTDAIRLGGIGAARESGAAHLAALGIAGAGDGHQPPAPLTATPSAGFPERFAEVARRLLPVSPTLLVFGSASERPLCEEVIAALRGSGIETRNLAGETTLREFIDLTSVCRLFLTNDSGAMQLCAVRPCGLSTHRWRCLVPLTTLLLAPLARSRALSGSMPNAAPACSANAPSITAA